MHLSYTEDQYVSSKFDLYVDKELSYLVRYYEWVVPKQHPVYKTYKGSMLNIALTNFISHLKSYSLCIGITAPNSQQTMSMTKHIISKKFNFIEYQNFQSQSPCNQIFYFQSNTWELLLPDGKSVCKDCNALKNRTVSERTWKSEKVSEQAKPKATFTLTLPERLKVNSVTLFFSFLNRKNVHIFALMFLMHVTNT